ncbi:MAG: phosphatase PAP2 family protein [Pseudolabrys sp.]
MTVENRRNVNAGAVSSMLRRAAANIIAALAVLLRPACIRSDNPRRLSPQWAAIAIGLVVLVFLLVQLVADAAAIKAVARAPRWVVWSFDQITDFGKSGWFLWPLGILFLMLAGLQTRQRISQLVLAAMMVRVGFLFTAIAAPGLFVNIIKHIFGRARPLVGGSLNPYLFNPFTWPAAYASLPSGHSATVFSVLVAFGTLWPQARAVLWIYAVLIAISRVMVMAHYPSDVLAGAAVGAAGALLVRRYFALRGLGFSVGADGAIHQYPGPSLRRIKSVARAQLAQ